MHTIDKTTWITARGYDADSPVGELMFDLAHAGSAAKRWAIWLERGNWTPARTPEEAEHLDACERRILGLTHAQQAELHRPRLDAMDELRAASEAARAELARNLSSPTPANP